MDNMNEPENQEHPDPRFRSLEQKVSTLERQIAQQQNQLRDYEKSLVERIADVDDDRRMTLSKLQRAWHSQREEINERVGRQMVFVIGAMVLFLAVVGIVLFLAYHQANVDRQLLADDLAELKQELDRTSGKQAVADSVQAELSRLSAAVNEISSTQGRQDEALADSLDPILEDERLARDAADALLGAAVQRLETKQESLMRELETMRKTLQTAASTKAVSDHQLPESAPAADTQQGAAQAPAAATLEPPLEFNPPPATERVSGSAKVPTSGAEQPLGDDRRMTVTDASPDAETPTTLVVTERPYALQLIGFYNLDTLRSFTDRNDLPEQLYYREERVQGRPWFALIHSMHEDYASAETQLQKLSPALIAMEPWIRPLPIGAELTVLDRGSKRRP
jgi:DamX protein